MTPAWSCLVTSNCSFVIGASADPIWRSSWTAPPNKSCSKAEIRCIWQRLTVGGQWAHICCYIRNIPVIVLKYTCWWGVGGSRRGSERLRSNLFSCLPLQRVFVWFTIGDVCRCIWALNENTLKFLLGMGNHILLWHVSLVHSLQAMEFMCLSSRA